jgi:hypothetical protein
MSSLLVISDTTRAIRMVAVTSKWQEVLMTDKEKIEGLVSEGMCLDNKEAYFFLIDSGEYEDDGTADDLFNSEFLERYPA